MLNDIKLYNGNSEANQDRDLAGGTSLSAFATNARSIGRWFQDVADQVERLSGVATGAPLQARLLAPKGSRPDVANRVHPPRTRRAPRGSLQGAIDAELTRARGNARR